MSPLPSRYYKIILPVLVFGAAALLCVFVGYKTLHESLEVTTAPSTATAPAPASTSTPTLTRTIPSSPTPAAAPNSNSSSSANTKTPQIMPAGYTQATLSISGTNYPLATPPNSTVETAMKILEASDSSFTFTEQTFPGLGEFVESINGKSNANGYYWFLYVNGKDSNTGVSQTILNPGDTIEWRYVHQ